MKQEKTTVKLPYDPKPYMVVDVKGAQVTCSRGGKEKKRTKEKIKVVKERPEHLKTGGQTTRDTNTDDDTEMEVEINLNLEEENPQVLEVDAEINLEGVGHPIVIEIDNDDTEVHAEINMEGVDHPNVMDVNSDGEDEFNDTEEITDEMIGSVDEINLPDIRVEPEVQIKVPDKRKQPSPREEEDKEHGSGCAQAKNMGPPPVNSMLHNIL